MKDFIKNQLNKSLQEFTSKTFNENYQAGLTDVRGPKPMKLKFYKNKVQVSYLSGLFPKSFTINPTDIVELELRVESVNTTGKTIAGAIVGNILAGPLGALAMGIMPTDKINKMPFTLL